MTATVNTHFHSKKSKVVSLYDINSCILGCNKCCMPPRIKCCLISDQMLHPLTTNVAFSEIKYHSLYCNKCSHYTAKIVF